MRVVMVPDADGGATTIRTDPAGVPLESPRHHSDAATAVADIEAADHPRWIWVGTAAVYPSLLRAGIRVGRCHDLALTHAILSMRDGVPAPPAEEPLTDDRLGLFDTTPVADPEQVVADFAAQRKTIGSDSRLDLLVAAESAGALAAAEMGFDGLPFSAPAHEAFLEAALGPRPVGYDLPQRIQTVSAEIGAAFGRSINPASHVEVIDAFRREGIELVSTRKHLLREIDHPAVPLLLHHRDLSKLFSTNGWQWLDSWVRDNRFRPVYVPGGVVSGRWATRGGGALQIPKPLRSSVIADPGHTFVIADAGQLEPRILAAMSGDPRMVAAAGADDLYAPVAAETFDGDRAKAKVAILGVLYGATAGEARSLLTLLRTRFPVAVEYVEKAARAGERGEVVHSWLGRACPPPAPDFWSHGDARSRGRFTRNFVVQATAAEWALCVLADLRRRLADDSDSELVFFQHDEVMVHTRNPETATRHVLGAVEVATRLLFGDTRVRFPMDVAVRDCYGESSIEP
ncbi:MULTISPECIES: bifunctional 3'-5' exonuclease/DNA polymerase [Rhodococcus]|uniref:DNA-directed DNA polymerase n=1 Tax=Rhodococcus oxybenzonivorans TaxID=1990687 RepID=A0AAE5A701_9NOCA|nr:MULTISPECIES: bifunctional 3'-5' exonuclease/DNA polymerase [Rhodococcus]MDV7241311.1 bifunctional 3'-5' exonuclease/DNA polymerase [Rhodococcus oxybenzonivorans]MDV7265971.1 bifunctional 3'-5' exonuclease/DNA polymerase [Rhodococcus oxybenzonivorans]MDV7274156.1 bifunctional 3'-5' exonuclease/DNA polymerase [Rhodococcus oxybenzonivorans]MDV7333591.1 bifunctional 3'-5' exonuclease/DNA polymerase [Rhodococcus oxybenzonivorans]MDV7343011.1 bifunctional 3'-5' exonuclease/DNA polymerase [Rhodoc